MMPSLPERRRVAGLCATCRHVRTTGNRRGSLFYLCLRSRDDPTFRKYPPLPVTNCPGYEEGEPDPWDSLEDDRSDQLE